VKLEKRIHGILPLKDESWQIVVIVGRSGSGKTTIAKNIVYCPRCGYITVRPDLDAEASFFCEKCIKKDGFQSLMVSGYIGNFEYTHKCFLDDFPQELETGEITKMLCSVGFASPPDWLKSYDCLSQGEKMRVDIARALYLNQNLIVFDEFTSVVDREIAKVSAYAISKAVRRSQKKFIAVTCHYDVLDWLDPDWDFSTDIMESERKKELGRPLNLKFIGAALPCGKYFGNIII